MLPVKIPMTMNGHRVLMVDRFLPISSGLADSGSHGYPDASTSWPPQNRPDEGDLRTKSLPFTTVST